LLLLSCLPKSAEPSAALRCLGAAPVGSALGDLARWEDPPRCGSLSHCVGLGCAVFGNVAFGNVAFGRGGVRYRGVR
jgi:hypothetical protein